MNYLFPIFHLLCRPLHSGSAPTALPKTLSPRCPVPQVARSRERFWVTIWLGRSSEAPLRLLSHMKGNATQFVAKRTVSFLYCLIMFSPPLLSSSWHQSDVGWAKSILFSTVHLLSGLFSSKSWIFQNVFFFPPPFIPSMPSSAATVLISKCHSLFSDYSFLLQHILYHECSISPYFSDKSNFNVFLLVSELSCFLSYFCLF